MKKKYIAPTVTMTKCQLLGFITASEHGGEGKLPDEDTKPVNPDPSEPDQHAKEHYNAWTAWED